MKKWGEENRGIDNDCFDDNKLHRNYNYIE